MDKLVVNVYSNRTLIPKSEDTEELKMIMLNAWDKLIEHV
jgi:hypothetical protein